MRNACNFNLQPSRNGGRISCKEVILLADLWAKPSKVRMEGRWGSNDSFMIGLIERDSHCLNKSQAFDACDLGYWCLASSFRCFFLLFHPVFVGTHKHPKCWLCLILSQPLDYLALLPWNLWMKWIPSQLQLSPGFAPSPVEFWGLETQTSSYHLCVMTEQPPHRAAACMMSFRLDSQPMLAGAWLTARAVFPYTIQLAIFPSNC